MNGGFFLVIASAVLFGLMPILAKQIYSMGGNALSLCVYRFLFSIPVLILVVKKNAENSIRITKKEAGKIFILSLGCAGTPLLLFQSYEYISSGMATTLHFIYPVFVIIGNILIFHEKMTLKKGICAALCVAGVLCFYTPGETEGLTGMILAFCSGIAYAFYVLYYAKSGLAEMDPYKLSVYLSLFGSAWLAAVTVAAGKLTVHLPLEAWGLILLFSVMVAVLATVFFQMGTRQVGPEMASLLSTFEPLTSVLVGAALYHESLGGRTVAGIFCILLSVVLLALGKKQ